MEVTLEIKRFDPGSEKEPAFEQYKIDVEPTDRVLDALMGQGRADREHQRHRGEILLFHLSYTAPEVSLVDAVGALQFPNIVDNHCHFSPGQTVHRRHVAKWPMVLAYTCRDRALERFIAMMRRFVNLVDKGRRQTVAATGIFTVARGAFGRENISSNLGV